MNGYEGLHLAFDAITEANITSLEVAQRYCNVAPVQKSGRMWACCLFHKENTPSMLFDTAGRFHCFGCGVGGDAISFVGLALNVTPTKAAKIICRDFALTTRNYSELSMTERRTLAQRQEETHKKREQQELIFTAYRAVCDAKRKAAQYCAAADPKTAWDDPAFVENVGLLGDCECWLDVLFEGGEAAITIAEKLAEAVRYAS